MTKGEIRKMRKAASAKGEPIPKEAVIPRQAAHEFTETPKGHRARDRWARHYDYLNGAPEGDWDR